MWREDEEQKICPVISRPYGIVLCQGKTCTAAYSRCLFGETPWSCEIIDGHPPRGGAETCVVTEGHSPHGGDDDGRDYRRPFSIGRKP